MGIDMGAREADTDDLGNWKRTVEGREQRSEGHTLRSSSKRMLQSRVAFWWKNPRLPRGSDLCPRTIGTQGSLYLPMVPWGLSSVRLAAPQEHQCRSGERKRGIRQERTSQKKMQGDLRANGPKMLITWSTAMVFTHNLTNLVKKMQGQERNIETRNKRGFAGQKEKIKV